MSPAPPPSRRSLPPSPQIRSLPPRPRITFLPLVPSHRVGAVGAVDLPAPGDNRPQPARAPAVVRELGGAQLDRPDVGAVAGRSVGDAEIDHPRAAALVDLETRGVALVDRLARRRGPMRAGGPALSASGASFGSIPS